MTVTEDIVVITRVRRGDELEGVDYVSGGYEEDEPDHELGQGSILGGSNREGCA